MVSQVKARVVSTSLERLVLLVNLMQLATIQETLLQPLLQPQMAQELGPIKGRNLRVNGQLKSSNLSSKSG